MITHASQNKIRASGASGFFLQKKEVNKGGVAEKSIPVFSRSDLTMGSRDDVYEKEADTMADKVMRMSIPESIGFSSSNHIISRKCAECEEEEKQLQKKESISDSASAAPSIVHDVLNSSGGKSLDTDTRSFMEPRFNYDFSHVKIHDNVLAAKSAGSINALAYTSGNNIVFNSGQYNTNSDPGKRLLAHELTHVVQQSHSILPELIQRESEEDSMEDDLIDEEDDLIAEEDELIGGMPGIMKKEDDKKKKVKKAGAKKPKASPNPCTRRILSEGTCEALVAGSKWICCDPDNGFKRPGTTTSVAEEGKTCTSETWTPIFTCDNNCTNALKKGCDDNDNWIAIPPPFDLGKCNDLYTICANGKQATGYVRDKSVTTKSYEVSPGIQKTLGVKVGDTFLGSVYRPGAKQTTIDKDACCNAPKQEDKKS